MTYPWTAGDRLYAADLDAAFAERINADADLANDVATKLPLSGGTLTGDLLSANTGRWNVPAGTTAQRPNTGNVGDIRYNSTTGRFEFGAGGSWRNFVRLDGDTLTGNLNLVGGAFTGTYSGTHTYSGAVTHTNALSVTTGQTFTVSGGSGTSTIANGIVTTARLVAGNASTFSWAGATSPTGFATERMNFNVNGATTSGVTAYRYTVVSSDTVDASASTNAANVFRIDHTMSAGLKGGRIGILYSGQVAGAPLDLPANSPQYVAVAGWQRSSVNVGGSAGTINNSSGVFFAGYDQVQLTSGATYWRGLVGREVDVQLTTGASAYYKFGIQTVLLNNDATQATGGVGWDAGHVISNQYTQAAGTGWLTAYAVGSKLGFFPIDPAGSIMECFTGSGTMLAAKGIDLSAVTFASSAFKSAGFLVNGSGDVTTANLAVVGNCGFYNTAPVAKPTGVAVSAAGIHAALVSLGLIAA